MSTGTQPGTGAAGVRAALAGLPPYCRVLVAGVAVNRLACFVELFLVLYLVDRGNSSGAAGLALSAFGVGTVIGMLCGGVLTERIGGRPSIVVSMVAAGAGTAALPLAHDLSTIVPLSALIGVATQLFRPAATSLLAAAAPPGDLVLVMAGYRFGLNVGAMITPLLGVALIAWSWNALFVVDAASSLLFAVLAYRVLPADRWRTEADVSRPGVGTCSARPSRDRRFLLVVAGLFLVAAVEVQYVATLPLEIHRQGIPTAFYAGLVAVNGLLVIAVEPPLTARLRRWPLRRSQVLGIGLIGLGIAAYGLPGGIAMLTLATVVWTVGEMVAAPAAGAYPALAAPAFGQARYLALASGAQGAGYAVGPAIGVATYTLSPAVCWLACAAVGLAAAGLAWRGARDVAVDSSDATQPAQSAGSAAVPCSD